MQRLSTVTNILEAEQKATARIAWAVASDSFLSDDPVQAFRGRGFGRYLPTTKAAIDPISGSDTGIGLQPLDTAFVGLVDRESVIGRLEGAVRLPLTAAARLQLGSVSAVVVDELAPKPIAPLTFDVPGAPSKVTALVVASAEALRSVDAASQDGIRAVLVSAVAEGTDALLVSSIVAASAPLGTATPAALLAAISNGSPRKPVLLGGLDMVLALPAGTIRDLEALGVPVLTTGAAQGVLAAIDAAGLLISDGGVEVAVARHATLELDTAPSGGTLTSLWQNNLIGLRAERLLRLTLRSGASAWSSGGTP
jgi:hypothetical protein